jgi:hypothetical protein
MLPVKICGISVIAVGEACPCQPRAMRSSVLDDVLCKKIIPMRLGLTLRRLCLVTVLQAVLILSAASQGRAEFQDCTTPEFAADKVQKPEFVCDPIRELSVEAFRRSVSIRTLRWKGDDTGLQYEPVVIEAAETTLAWLDGYVETYGLKVQDLTFVFANVGLTDPGNPMADSQGWDPKECVIRLNVAVGDSASVGDALQDFRNSIAHEIFHCIQGATWPQQFDVAQKDTAWWREGTAQFIAHWIYPNHDDLEWRAAKFANEVQATPLHQSGKDGGQVVFFAWLASGNVYPIFDFIAAMPTVPGEAAQKQALLERVPPYLLSEFPRDWVDGNIKMPDGFTFLKVQPLDNQDVRASGPLVIDAVPLTMFLQDVTYIGGTYMITGHGEPDVSYRAKGSKPGEWSGIGLINVDQDCQGDTTLRFAGMGFGTGPEPVTLEAMKSPGCEECVVASGQDACLIGTWVADQGDLSRVIYDMAPASVSDVEVSGNFGVKFDPDGKAYFGFHKLRIKLNYTDEGVSATAIDIGGSVDNSWTTDNQNLYMCYERSDAAIQIVIPKSYSRDAKGQMTENPSTSEIMKFKDLPRSKNEVYDFACTGKNELTMG